jgi:large subunit ribosomal protein L17
MSNRNRKFHRETDQRRALLRTLAISLFEHQSIETTLPRAKTLAPFAEKLISKGKVGTLNARRAIISALASEATAKLLIEEIGPKLKHRTSGHLRIERTAFRRGDNAQMARISFVDDLKAAVAAPAKAKKVATAPAEPKVAASKPAAKKPAAKKAEATEAKA